MKRILLVLVLCLCLCLGTGVADSINCYNPTQMSAAMNEILPLVMKAFGVTDTSVIQSAADYLSVSYTETEDSVIYYNNSDWKVELSFYFTGKAGKNQEADAVNLVISNNLNDIQVQALLYTFGIALSYENPSIDQDEVLEYLTETAGNLSVLETPIGSLSYVPTEEAYQFALYKTVDESADTMLLSDRNISVELIGIQPYVSKSYPAALEVHVRLTNQTNKMINLTGENATVNGIPVKVVGIYDIAPKSVTEDEYLILKAETKAAQNAVCTAREALVTLVASENESGKTVAKNQISLSLDQVPSFTPYPDAVKPTATPKPTARPRTTVRPTATPRTRATVKPTATSRPKATATPRAISRIQSLDFSERMWAQWEFKTGNKLSIRFEMTAAKRVRSFELYLYATDSRGNRIYGANQIYYATTTKSISSGATAYSDYILIPDQQKIDKVYCGIKRVELSDGTVEEVPDSQVEYFYWTIQ